MRRSDDGAWRRSLSGLVVEGDVIAVRIGESEGAPEGAIDRSRNNGVAIRGKGVMDFLHASGVEPDRRTHAWLGE